MTNTTLHLLLLLFWFFITSISCETTAVPVGVILDSNLPVGKIAPICIKLAVTDFYMAHPNYTTRLDLQTRDSHGDVVSAASAAVDLMRIEEVHAIIGPQTSVEASFVANLGTRSMVPIVSFSATTPSLTPARAHYFVRTAPSDAAQAPAIAALVQAFGWRRAVPVYEDTDYGTGFIPYLVDALDDAGARVPYRSVVPTSASDDRISEELYRLMTMQTRVFIVHMRTTLAARLFSLAKDSGMMDEGYVWIATAGLTGLLGSIDPSVVLESMQGVLGVKPYVPRTKEFQDFRRRFKVEFIKENPHSVDVPEPSTYGIWAYDTVWALALATETVGAKNLQLDRPKPVNGSTELSSLGVLKTGQRLLDTILNTQFESIGGRFRLAHGERNVSEYQVVNVVGEKPREIGFWTPRYGLTRRLNFTSASPYSATRDGLGPVIWPGESSAVPRGWEMPTSGKKLRIAVPGPVDPGFHAFLSVETDPVTNETVAGGFVIEVFEAAVRRLPYALPFEYVRYVNASGKSAGDYNELVKQVTLQKYDAIVGDVTITANRSLLLDFTLPYTVAGIKMVVPVKDKHSKNPWIFLKPLTADLWWVSGTFFVLTGFIIWALEHRVNDEFRGSPTNQIGTVFYFTFSTLVFAHKEKMVSNLSRVVMIIWVFVVLILQSSYTASLTSMLTVSRFEPTVTDMKELIENKQYVGYLKDSFVKGFLIKLGFDESKLRPYSSPQQYSDALAKGNDNGGVAAIIDEIPYLKVFLKNYCDNYTMAEQTYKTGGFGFSMSFLELLDLISTAMEATFNMNGRWIDISRSPIRRQAFPKGSPLVADLSRAILNITEGDEMKDIEKRWLGDESNCPNQSSFTSNSLDFRSFWGLFLITGFASILALTSFWVRFCCKHMNEIRSGNPSTRIRSMAKLFDERDLTCRTFRRRENNDGSTGGIRDPTASPSANGIESPLSISNHTYQDSRRSAERMSLHSETPNSVGASSRTSEDTWLPIEPMNLNLETPTRDDMNIARDG